jgi:hypothetical protein
MTMVFLLMIFHLMIDQSYDWQIAVVKAQPNLSFDSKPMWFHVHTIIAYGVRNP